MKRKNLRFGRGFRVAIGNRRSQAAEMVIALAERGVAFYCARPSFTRREFQPDALRPGARLAEEAELATLVAAGRTPVTL